MPFPSSVYCSWFLAPGSPIGIIKLFLRLFKVTMYGCHFTCTDFVKIYMFFTSAGGLLVPDGITPPSGR
jgi:hypothetical protein